MHILFPFHHSYLYSSFKSCYKGTKFLLPVSLLHSSKQTLDSNSMLDFVFDEVESLNSSSSVTQIAQSSSKTNKLINQSEHTKRNELNVQISHPWPEWVYLMELLLKRGYFNPNENPFLNGELGTKEMNWIRTACLTFARDQLGLMRFFSRKDIHAIARCGCPSIDRKVVNSGKRLRAHVGIDEGNVCSSCKFRGDCERAYVKAREYEGGRTVDVMRILLTYGFNSLSGNLENRPFDNKMVKDSVRVLLKEMVDYGRQQLDSDPPDGTPLKSSEPLQIHSPTKQGDWCCPKCNFLNFARNIRCLQCDSLFEDRLKQLQEDQHHLPLKKGDWICEKCNFLNFAKNTRCLQCKEKPPKRHLNPGEWECESCNYINFRRNMVCLKCDHRRPKALNAPSNTSTPLEHDSGGLPNHRRLRFVHGDHKGDDDKSMQLDRMKQRRGVDRWRFVEEEREDNHLWNKDSSFVDFPVVGGQSSLSRNSQNGERWKLEMLQKSRTTGRTGESDEESRRADTQRRFKFLETTDDEDMAEWFGHTK